MQKNQGFLFLFFLEDQLEKREESEERDLGEWSQLRLSLNKEVGQAARPGPARPGRDEDRGLTVSNPTRNVRVDLVEFL